MSDVRLGLRENLGQFSLLVVVNAFVGAMVGMERTILPAIAEQDFGLSDEAFRPRAVNLEAVDARFTHGYGKTSCSNGGRPSRSQRTLQKPSTKGARSGSGDSRCSESA